jgi:hypothetical protein
MDIHLRRAIEAFPDKAGQLGNHEAFAWDVVNAKLVDGILGADRTSARMAVDYVLWLVRDRAGGNALAWDIFGPALVRDDVRLGLWKLVSPDEFDSFCQVARIEFDARALAGWEREYRFAVR